MKDSTHTALIVGAGIGGLAAGLALRRAGWQVRIFERAKSPRELGFALLLAPNAMRALRALGLADTIAAAGVIVTSGEMRRPNGDVLRRLDTSSVATLLGEPTVMVLRPVLHGALLDAVGDGTLALDADVAGVRSDAAGVEVMLANGETARGAFLVGADGVGSVIRRQLHPNEPPPRRSGHFGLRGVAHDPGHVLGRQSGCQYLGRGVEAGVARASETAVYWFLSLPARRVVAGPRDPAAVLRRSIAGFHEPFRSLVMTTRAEDMRLDELFDRDPVGSWGSGLVTLLGDAAHPMLPHAGQGAAQALEDGVALARALAAATSIEKGLRRYEEERSRRTAKIVRLARRNARVSSVDSAFGCWIRDFVVRSVPESVILKSLVALNRPG